MAVVASEDLGESAAAGTRTIDVQVLDLEQGGGEGRSLAGGDHAVQRKEESAEIHVDLQCYAPNLGLSLHVMQNLGNRKQQPVDPSRDILKNRGIDIKQFGYTCSFIL